MIWPSFLILSMIARLFSYIMIVGVFFAIGLGIPGSAIDLLVIAYFAMDVSRSYAMRGLQISDDK